MATRSTRQVASAGGSPRHVQLHKSEQSSHVTGQLIVRFKTSAVRHVAASPLTRFATARMAAQAMPDEMVLRAIEDYPRRLRMCIARDGANVEFH